jgi:hypothetical protein
LFALRPTWKLKNCHLLAVRRHVLIMLAGSPRNWRLTIHQQGLCCTDKGHYYYYCTYVFVSLPWHLASFDKLVSVDIHTCDSSMNRLKHFMNCGVERYCSG